MIETGYQCRGVGVEALEPRALLAGQVYDHVVVVVEENHSYAQVIGNPDAPYTNFLAASGLSLTDSHGLTHPSQPNYLHLFSGSNQGVEDNNGPYEFVGVPNLGGQLFAAGKSFIGYAEDLPEVGSEVITFEHYDRRHNPWVDFDDVPATSNRPFTDFPTDYATLPTVAFVVPNELHNSHDGPIADADVWLEENLGGYAAWAKTHNSLLIVTWDEGFDPLNHVPTIFYGANVRTGQYAANVTHHNVLRTIQDFYGLTPIAGSITATPIDLVEGPSRPDLSAGSDSGLDDADDVTNVATPTFTGTAKVGVTVKILSDGVVVGSAVAAADGTYSVTVSPLGDGVHVIRAGQAAGAAGGVVGLSAPLTVTVDRAGPKVLHVRFNDSANSANVRRIGLGFNEVVRVALTDLRVRNDSTGQNVSPAKMAMAYSGVSNQATWTFPGLPHGMPANGNYTATLFAAVSDLAGNTLDGNGNGAAGDAKTFTFHQLLADANADRVVDEADAMLLFNRLGMSGPAEAADFNGDGHVGFVDFQILELSYGQALPGPPVAAAGVVAGVKAAAKPVVAARQPAFGKRRIAPRRVLAGLLG